MINLTPGETILYEARRHWIVLLGQIFFLCVLKIVPLFLLAFVPFLPLNFKIVGDVPILILFLYACWLNLIWIAIFYVWTNYVLTLWIVTDKRLIMIHQQGFFNREKREFDLDKIQDIKVDEEGFIAHMLGFGTVSATTASETGGFALVHVAHPDKLKDTLVHALHKE
jgi:uncharacterized membrane protein YdbT with pleckstrin-like domain